MIFGRHVVFACRYFQVGDEEGDEVGDLSVGVRWSFESSASRCVWDNLAYLIGGGYWLGFHRCVV